MIFALIGAAAFGAVVTVVWIVWDDGRPPNRGDYPTDWGGE